jgi:succinyl-diaminopimelate desuccinylase
VTELDLGRGPAGITADLLAIPSVSHHEAALADAVERALQGCPGLTVARIGDSVVARTDLDRRQRVILAGHLDTVPPVGGNERPSLDGDVLSGLGATDMKGGLGAFLHLAHTVTAPAVDVTWCFYAGEEVEHRFNGLVRLWEEHPELLAGDVALLGEPTAGVVEAGCQGTLRITIGLSGRRAHTARPWMGRNAIHRLAPVLASIAAFEERRPTIDGCEYREQLQAVGVEGGVAGNVVPDRAAVTLNHRFAPDRSADAAETKLRELLDPHLEPGDSWQRTDRSSGAPPGLTHPFLAELCHVSGQAPRAKLGWTDVATFWAHGVPATNFGPGDPELAHTPDERITIGELNRYADTVAEWLGRLG